MPALSGWTVLIAVSLCAAQTAYAGTVLWYTGTSRRLPRWLWTCQRDQ